MQYPEHLLKLITLLKRFPGVGAKSAERYAFEMLDWPHSKLKEMATAIEKIPEKLKHCHECGCLIDNNCGFCSPERKSAGVVCVISSARDAYAIEETREYKGLYHVLGGLLSPMDGIGPEKLNFDALKNRIQRDGIREVVLALDSTLDGDATSLYLKNELESLQQVNVSRLAFGLPVGSSLDYVDGGTLARALSGRNSF